EASAAVRRDHLGIRRQQISQRVVVTFRLYEQVILEISALAERAIHRADDGRRILLDRSGAGAQTSCEKVVEAAVRVWVALYGFTHVDAIDAEKNAQDRVPDRARFAARQGVHRSRQQMFRQNVL